MWVVHVYTLVSGCFSLNCEVPLPGGCCSQKNESPLSFLNYLVSEGDLFCLSLAVHYRPLGLWACVHGAALGMVSSLQMVCRALQPLGFSFPSLLPCLPLPPAFHGFCIPSLLAKGIPGLEVNPGHSPC